MPYIIVAPMYMVSYLFTHYSAPQHTTPQQHNSHTTTGVLSYPLLRPANVSGTMEVLRLAAHGAGGTVLHYVSTLSVLDGSSEATKEDFPIGKLLHRVSSYSGYGWALTFLLHLKVTLTHSPSLSLFQSKQVGSRDARAYCDAQRVACCNL